MTRGLVQGISQGLLTSAVLAAVAVSGMTHDAPLGDYVGTSQVTDEKPVNVPEWQPEYADRFAGCVASLPSGTIPATVVVVKRTGDVIRMDFDRAWTVAHNSNAADDVWVVGACR